VQQQAQFMSYLDMFHLLGIGALLVWPLALLLGAPPKSAAKGVVYEV
jgi:DHA2 family multidrug resistance protein